MHQQSYSWSLFPKKHVSLFHARRWISELNAQDASFIYLFIYLLVVPTFQLCYITKNQQCFHPWSYFVFHNAICSRVPSQRTGTIINCSQLHRTTYPYPFTWSSPSTPTSFSPSLPHCSHPLCLCVCFFFFNSGSQSPSLNFLSLLPPPLFSPVRVQMSKTCMWCNPNELHFWSRRVSPSKWTHLYPTASKTQQGINFCMSRSPKNKCGTKRMLTGANVGHIANTMMSS